MSQIIKKYTDSSYTSAEMYATTYYERCEDKVVKEAQSMAFRGYKVKEVITTGSRGFFVNDLTQTVIYEKIEVKGR